MKAYALILYTGNEDDYWNGEVGERLINLYATQEICKGAVAGLKKELGELEEEKDYRIDEIEIYEEPTI